MPVRLFMQEDACKQKEVCSMITEQQVCVECPERISKLEALVRLLDDASPVVRDTVTAEFMSYGPQLGEDLRRLATLLKPYVTAYRIEVEGHTDAATAAGGQASASNRELGLTRARAALDVLVKAGGLPAAYFSVSSAGDTSPLSPGESIEARRRNRTVVIKLHNQNAK